MRHLELLSLPLLVALTGLAGLACADPCVDDGLGQKSCPSAADAGATDTSATGAESGSGSAGEAETGDGMSTGDGDGTPGDGDGTPGDGDGDGTPGDGDGDIPPSCANGVLDGDETDIDCGGSCPDCLDGDLCLVDADCINGLCNAGVCKDPVCDPAGNNGCQGCLQQQCCDSMIACFEDPSCVCWFECISHNNDFEPCKTACNIGNIGPITSCANSKCNTADACAI